MNMRDEQLIKAVIAGVAPVIKEYTAREIEAATSPLVARVAELEAQPAFKYCGTWNANTQYVRGCFVTDHGGLWHCNEMTMERPGTSKHWTLACKRGSDGKVAS